MAQAPLIVPVHCDALVANNAVLARDSFRWWPFDYTSLRLFRSPEPHAVSGQAGTPKAGVYLQWTLPRGLRHGYQKSTGGIAYPLVPNRWLVVRLAGSQPRNLKAWVLESDCPYTSQVTWHDSTQTSLYLADPDLIRMWKGSGDRYRNGVPLDPASTAVQWTTIGVHFPLDQGWTERAANTMFLTAVGPSNPVFSAYYPHNRGVFSFYDDLAHVDQDTLSYLIVGWYSDATKDILAAWPQDAKSKTPFQDALERLEWQLIGPPDGSPTSSLYHGAVFSVAWNRKGPPPANDPLQAIRDSRLLNVAVGNTTIDAFTALIAAQTGDQQKADLLRAFQHDFLDLLNQVNGEALLDRRIRQEWFGTKPGGYSWAITARESDGSAAPSLTDPETQWLAQVNRDQSGLDAAVGELFGRQWQLNATWYKNGYLSIDANTFAGPPDGIPQDQLQEFQDRLADALDPAKPDPVPAPPGAATTNPTPNFAARLVGQLQAVKAAMKQVPQPDWRSTLNAQEAFELGIAAFAGLKGISPSNVLKAVAAPRFAQPNNPVILISGVEPSEASDPNQVSKVRSAGGVVTQLQAGGKVIDSALLARALPALPSPGGLPALAPPLLTEFILLDPASAAAIAAAAGLPAAQVSPVIAAHAAASYQGTLPGLDLTPWGQPWNPMFVEWTVSYSHIPYQTGGNRNWLFDGNDYALTAPVSDITAEEREIGGISLLSPHAQFVFGARLDAFVKKYGAGSKLAELDAWIGHAYGWKFLAQELTGFNDALALRDTRAYRRPTGADTIGTGAPLPLADLLGYPLDTAATAYTLPAPYRGRVESVPYLPNGPAIPFHGERQGQLYFKTLFLYDAFGRQLFLIQSGTSSGLFDFKNFPLLIDAALRPDPAKKLHPEVSSVVQLSPRMLQHARLEFAPVDGTDDSRLVQLDPAANPVCGWILPNHLGGSILVYAPDGKSLGEFRLVETAEGRRVGEWQPPPHRDITLADVARMAPRLHDVLAAPPLADEANFQAFLGAIDSTLWTVDPLGNRSDRNLSVLIGRPLALVRARLQFQLDGQPLRDTGWAATFDTGDPEFIQYLYSIRLGDQATRQDGVIGYYLGDDHARLNSVVAPGTTQPQTYLTPIGPIGAPSGNYIDLPFKDGCAAYVTLLMDPRASAHAITGLLPAKRMDVPVRFLEGPLAAMEATFRQGPIITLIQPTPSQGDQPPPFPTSVTVPRPAEQNGTWSWWEGGAASKQWTGYDLIAATPNAQFTDNPITVRDGFLQFVAADIEK